MSDLTRIKNRLSEKGWFGAPGVYALCDGQFGSTGKGLMAAAMAEMFPGVVDWNITNAGPNSGHTFYRPNGNKVVLKQLPSFAVAEKDFLRPHWVGANIALTNGAIIDNRLLRREMEQHDIVNVHVGGAAALINPVTDLVSDQENVANIASTGQGTGPALARKVNRVETGIHSLPGLCNFPENFSSLDDIIFMEISQGFSLGINSGFYPYTTSRECTVAQGLSDASIAPKSLRKTIMCLRTFPIRVGNSPEGGYSGPCYPDQHEISWGDLGVEPELTTVTGRVRRVFTWSDLQFRQALRANMPDVLFINFCNYLRPGKLEEFIEKRVITPYSEVMGHNPEAVIAGYGPKSSDLYFVE